MILQILCFNVEFLCYMHFSYVYLIYFIKFATDWEIASYTTNDMFFLCLCLIVNNLVFPILVFRMGLFSD